MSLFKPIAVLLLGAMTAIVSSCTYDTKEAIAPDYHLPVIASFHGNIIPLFNQYCNNTGCHDAVTHGGNLDLSDSVAYHNLLKTGSVDTLVTPKSTLLYFELTTAEPSMPLTGRLSDSCVALVLEWITQGARNN
jgi:hypothetical protein